MDPTQYDPPSDFYTVGGALAHLAFHNLNPAKVRAVLARGVGPFFATTDHLHRMVHELAEWAEPELAEWLVPVQTQTEVGDG